MEQNMNHGLNTYDPPKITLTLPKTKSSSTNIGNARKTRVKLGKKKPDEENIINKNQNKEETDEIFIDPFSRWMHQRVGKTFC